MKPTMNFRVEVLLNLKSVVSQNPAKNQRISQVLLLKRITATLCFVLFVYVLYDTHTAISELEPNRIPNYTLTTFNAKAPLSTAKIYMYNLPERFTYWHRPSSIPGCGRGNPRQRLMAEWALFYDLSRKSNKSAAGSAVVRVSDPNEADLFFVPYLASVSEAVKDGEEVMEWVESREEWQRTHGRDHVVPAVIGQLRETHSMLLVSDFGGSKPSLLKDVLVPYCFQVNPFQGSLGISNRTTLLFFAGPTYCKQCGDFRKSLLKVLETEDDVEIKSGIQSILSPHYAALAMHTSKFCLILTGDTPSSITFFDSIASLCVPVIVSNTIDLPFENVIDYTKIAIFVETSVALKPGFLVSMLRTVPIERILELQNEMNRVRHYFEYGEVTVNEIWRQVVQKLSLIKLMINRDKRRVQTNKLLNHCCICSNHSGIV